MIYRKALFAVIAGGIVIFLSSFLPSCIEAGDDYETASREQAEKTDTSYLEICKQGQIEEAAQEFIDNPDVIDGDLYNALRGLREAGKQ